MPRTILPLAAADLSAFARSLSTQLGDTSPSHLRLMNMLARAAGFQNVQHLRASHAAGQRMAKRDDERSEAIDHRRVERALNQFDEAGRLVRWPAKRSVQELALWALWSRLPSTTSMTEREVSDRLRDHHSFNDPATLRRTMLGSKLLTRQRDGTDYRRVEGRPPAEARALIAVLSKRQAVQTVESSIRG